ncbi:pilus assembly protein [Roseibium denhamense]|uniref:Pilus assembly protein CpaD n=1 Tax=Roseibium denhamense TaxID=76305 RepID=A0ABY1P098_9HYPH|nr:CpaD family pilus assembly protein [Roseibium denhamense]MTI04912.1 pilus assembly protein [Roseibium denhamense]SMP23005.1 pilus assembly protein CpaD [Roseibium denhamense]
MQKLKTIRSATGLHAGALCLAVLLGGCQNNSQTPDQMLASHDYRYQHPIVLTEAPKTLDLPIGRNTRQLVGPIEDTVTQFAMESRTQGNGKVEVLIPSGAANESAVHSVSKDIRTALQRGGLSRSQISTRTYPVSDAGADAPIRLSYIAMQATAGKCGNWPKNITGGIGENNNYYNFGCASQANLAAIVENPSDLITPRASTPADRQRRATVFENYRAGQITAGEYEEGVGAEVADVAQ